MEYRVRRTGPWGNERFYLDGRPRDWNPAKGNKAAEALNRIRPFPEIWTRWETYSSEEIEASIANPPQGSPDWASVDELIELLSVDPNYEVRIGEALASVDGNLIELREPQDPPGILLPSAELSDPLESMQATFKGAGRKPPQYEIAFHVSQHLGLSHSEVRLTCPPKTDPGAE